MKAETIDLFKFKDLVDKETPFVVEFKSNGCPICVDFASDYQKVAKTNPTIPFFVVDVNEEEDLADLFITDGVPTFFYIKGKSFLEIPFPEEGLTRKSFEKAVKKMVGKTNGK